MAKRQQRVHKRKRFILVHREHGNVLGDTGYRLQRPAGTTRSPDLSPVKAAAMLQSRGATDHYPVPLSRGETQPSECGVRRLPRTAGFSARLRDGTGRRHPRLRIRRFARTPPSTLQTLQCGWRRASEATYSQSRMTASGAVSKAGGKAGGAR